MPSEKVKKHDNKKLTNAAGIPVQDNQNSLTAGPHGPMVFEDAWYFEKMSHFVRERIPERVVHAKGAGAFGTFTVTNDITKYTKAKIFDKVGKKTPVFVRFSTVAGELGSADVERDPRGFAVKLYTEEGNWDLVGNNTPIFFIRDALKFPDFIHTQKRDPKTHLKNPTMAWDFWSHTPESVHQLTILFSDRGIPDGFRFMNGYGSHTFSMINAKNERVWVKFHWKSMQGIKTLTNREAEAIAAKDRDSALRDLEQAINKGDFPKWKLHIQVLTTEQLKDLKFDPFDVTKVWPHKIAPLIEVGVMELNKNPDNYFQDVEMSTFNPANVVPGISYSPDRMLQGRLFAYGDAHRYRVGINSEQLPVNAPKCPYATTHRDGFMNDDHTIYETVNYEPNSQGVYLENLEMKDPAYALEEAAVYRYDYRQYDNDYYSQPNALYQLMSEDQKKQLTNNIVESMMDVPKDIQLRQLQIFKNVNDDYGLRIAKGLKLEADYKKLK